MTPPPLPPLLLVGSGSELRHRQVLSDLSRKASLVLLQPGPVTWQKQYVHRSAEINPSDVSSVLETVRSLVRDLQLEAVVTYDESLLLLAGEISHAGLRGLSRQAATVVRDKHAQRTILSQLSRAVRSKLVFDATSGEAAAAELGYPVVIKPRNLSGNLGIRIVPSPAEFRTMFEEATTVSVRGLKPTGGALVEEFLEGPEFSIDCWVLEGQASALFTARILTSCAPHLIDTGGVVGPGIANSDAIAAMQDAACVAALACGLDRTIANVDVKWTREEPRVLEVNGRPGGLLPLLALLTSGLRVGEALAEVALGRPPTAPPAHRAAGIALIYPPTAVHFRGLHIPPELAKQDWLVRVQEASQIGARVMPPALDPWGHVGWALVTGENAGTVLARLELVWENVKVLKCIS